MKRLLILIIASAILLIGCTDAVIPQIYTEHSNSIIQTETKVKGTSFKDFFKNLEEDTEE